MIKSNNNTKKIQKKFETLFQERIEGAFGANVGVTVSKKDRWVNIAISLFNGLKFQSQEKEGMIVQLRPQKIKELIQALQEAFDLQFLEFEKIRQVTGEKK